MISFDINFYNTHIMFLYNLHEVFMFLLNE
jgi:hypothetical protein